ncbi:ribosome-associated translation inhibitor RaiA [Blastococcus sp. TML/M2B]|uniref:ribosome hibernation-promoting factor, HPF/YfiA family n=1 Tax=unclassified Blastococcus TaxID=2619396 RepID=UPI00190C5295|nr:MULTISPECIES: ribosome-associated translation inhibitor RaiA [unclassified Blastococcus]MBN1093788.1 ribosome-associated translation inhibitor RaiA [Blastococcus sp. TML/M2B]MBN1096089.1 ribosome-associated translation inhibitor RaiA [Blastococcus sp. TML/C7B]
MEIVVRGRNVEVPEHYRQLVEDKVGTTDRFDRKLKILRIDVELFHEKNPRQAASAQRVEITLRGKGPVVRAEANGPDFYAALDLAVTKLDNRLRRAADRRRVHHGRRTPASVRMADSGALGAVVDVTPTELDQADGPLVTELDEHLPGRIVREKIHPATPMHVDQALHEMELVGHDFFLFQCADTGQPTVVYRRHAYDYGLIRLAPVSQDGVGSAPVATPAGAPA